MTQRFDTSNVDWSELSIWYDPTFAKGNIRVDGGFVVRERRLVAVGAHEGAGRGRGGTGHLQASYRTPTSFPRLPHPLGVWCSHCANVTLATAVPVCNCEL